MQEADNLLMDEVVYLNEKNVKPRDFESNMDSDRIWYLDNGASNHMTGNRNYFKKIDETITGKVRFGDDSRIDIKGKGSILFISQDGGKKLLADVFIPALKSNIINLGQATESGCVVNMKGNVLTLHDKEGKLITQGSRSQNRLYKVPMDIVDEKCLKLAIANESARWHARLGHIGVETMKLMIRKELVSGIPNISIEKEACESCALGKQTRQAFPKATLFRAEEPLELIHGDLCGPITPATPARNKYIFVLVDDHTRYMWTILMKEKSDAFEKFKAFKTMIEQQTQKKIKTLRADRGGEFTSTEFQCFCEKSGIQRHLTAPYTPQQNGVVERRNRTLLEMTRSILKHMRIPYYLWGEAIRHATYLINRVGTRTLQSQTPYEVLKGKKPNVKHLRVFGCIGYAKIETPHLRKLDDRSRTLVHLGTEPGSKAYRMFDPTSKRVVVSRDVIFDESKGWKWNNSVTDEGAPGEFSISFSDFSNQGIREDVIEEGESHEENSSNTKLEEDDTEQSESEQSDAEQSNTEQGGLRRSTRISKTPSYQSDYILLGDAEGERLLLLINEEPWDFTEAVKDKVWKKACDDEIESIIKNNTWDLVELPEGAKAIGLKVGI